MEDYILQFCERKLADNKLFFYNSSVSISKIVEAVSYSRRDLERIAIDLKDSVSRQKFAAYYGFWFAKIAPLSAVFRPDRSVEIVDISERIAILLMHDLMLRGIGTTNHITADQSFDEADQAQVGYDRPAVPSTWRECTNTCIGECFTTGFRRYLSYNKWQNFEYLVRLLRHRTAGPYELVSILETAVIVSCTGFQPSIVSGTLAG